MKYIKNPIAVEAITFEELVAHGIAEYKRKGMKLARSLPWSFDYNNGSVTHENDDCYLIGTLEGTMRFNRGDMLITGVQGEIYPCKKDIFEATYSPVEIGFKPYDHGDEPLKVMEAAVTTLERVYCDCTQADPCPNGKTGSADRCSIMRKVEPLQDATYEPDLIAEERSKTLPSFHEELNSLINRHSMENGSNTPDWILADYLMGCMRAYEMAIHYREEYHGRPGTIGVPEEAPPKPIEDEFREAMEKLAQEKAKP